MKFVLQFENLSFFVGRDENGHHIKTDDPVIACEWDSYNAARESEACKAFPHDRLTVMPAEGEDFSACLGEDEGSCVMDCGCVLYRSASYTDREVSITFCPLHEQAERFREVLGRLHDLCSELVEDPDRPDWPERKAMVDLLVNDSLPLFAPGERGKAPAAPVVPVAPPVAVKVEDRAIPADPEDKNEERSGWAASALDEFQSLTNCDDEDRLCDLLANLGHYADRNGLDLGAELRRAEFHYVDESGGEGVQFDFLPPVSAPVPDWHEVRKVLVLSTLHLRQESFELYTIPDRSLTSFELHPIRDGHVCKLPADDEDAPAGKYESDLLAVFDYARSVGLHDYELIIFDCDGPQVPALPVYPIE